jgi:hypothetical protein
MLDAVEVKALWALFNPLCMSVVSAVNLACKVATVIAIEFT